MLDDIFLRHVERFLGRSRPDQLALNQKALGNHRTLVDAIASRKPKRAEAAWQDPMDQLRQVLIAELGPTTVLVLYFRRRPSWSLRGRVSSKKMWPEPTYPSSDQA